MQANILFAVQKSFAGISKLSPRLAARMVHGLITNPSLLVRPSSEERELLANNEPILQRADALTVMAPAGAMRVYHWTPESDRPADAPVAVLVHGWGARAAHMAGFVPLLLSQGYQVAAPELPGHGTSAKGSLTISSADAVIKATSAALGGVNILMGHSFGASAVLNAAQDLNPDKLVLLAAPSSLEQVYRRIARLLEISLPAEDELIKRLELSSDVSMAHLNAEMQLVHVNRPCLAIHDEDDFEIPINTSIARSNIQNMKAFITKGHAHRGVLSAPEVMKAVTKFTKRR
ncbi:MAG: alpha/beta hydrolase [Hyphomicrobiales bacterium]